MIQPFSIRPPQAPGCPQDDLGVSNDARVHGPASRALLFAAVARIFEQEEAQ